MANRWEDCELETREEGPEERNLMGRREGTGQRGTGEKTVNRTGHVDTDDGEEKGAHVRTQVNWGRAKGSGKV